MSTPIEEIDALRARWAREWQEFQARFTAEMDRIEAMIRDTHNTTTDPIDIPVVRIVPRAVPAALIAALERGTPMSQAERGRILMRLKYLEVEVASYKEKYGPVSPARATGRRGRTRT